MSRAPRQRRAAHAMRSLAIAGMSVMLAAVPAGAQSLNGHPDLRGVYWNAKPTPGLKPVDGKPLPFTAAGRAMLEKSAADTRAAADPKQSGDMRRCLPFGPSRILDQDYPVEIVQTGDTFIILYEHNHVYETIFMGEKHPADPDIAYMGHSVGRWTGDGVAIDTVAFNDETVLDDAGVPHSDKLHVERTLRRVQGGALEIMTRITDPVVFTRPVTVRHILAARPDARIEEYTCGQGPTLETRYTRALPPKPDPVPERPMPGGPMMGPSPGGMMGPGGAMGPGGMMGSPPAGPMTGPDARPGPMTPGGRSPSGDGAGGDAVGGDGPRLAPPG